MIHEKYNFSNNFQNYYDKRFITFNNFRKDNYDAWVNEIKKYTIIQKDINIIHYWNKPMNKGVQILFIDEWYKYFNKFIF